MYTDRRQELKKKALLEVILQTQVVGMWMKGLTGSSYSKQQRLSSFKRRVFTDNWCYSVLKRLSTLPHKTSMIKFYTTVTMPVVVTSKVLQTKLSRKYHDHREVKKTKNYIRRNFMVNTWHSGLNGNYSTWMQSPRKWPWMAKWGGQETLRLGLCKWAIGLVQN